MQTDHIKDIITEYLNKEKTQYAILVNGTWGSGKTFFWKSEIEKLVRNISLKPIYISLNGLKSIEQLQQQLMIKLLPLISKAENKTLKNALTLIGNVGNRFSKAILRLDFSSILSGVSLDGFTFSDKVICFDDLERCQIPIKEVLGFINDFVEHRNLKCLILADENKIIPIETNGVTDYVNIKEKVIGRVLNYEPELEKVIPALFDKHKNNAAYYDFLQVHKEYILGIFFEYEEHNLRVISFFLDSLEKLFTQLVDVDLQYQKESILFAALISIEFKSGTLTTDKDSKDLENVTYFWYQNMGSESSINSLLNIPDTEETAPEPTYAQKFYLKYVDSRVEEFQYFQSIFSYIISGYLDVSKFAQELEDRKPEQGKIEEQKLVQLCSYDFRSLSSDDFDSLKTEVMSFAEDGVYSIYDYDRLSNFYHYFSDNALVDLTEADVNSKLLAGLDIAAKRKEINLRVYENIAHFTVNDPKMQVVRDAIIAHHSQIKEEYEATESNVLLELLSSNNIEDLAQLFESTRFSKEFLKYINGKELFTVLNGTSNETLADFNKAMSARYKHASLKQFYPDDFNCLNDLMNEIEQLLEKDESLDKLRIFLWKELLDVLKKTCEELRS